MNLKGILNTNAPPITGTLVIGGGGGGNIQASKTVTPADVLQNVLPDAGYDGLGRVVVEAIPSNYGHIAYNGGILKVY